MSRVVSRQRCRAVSRCRVWLLDTVEHGFSLERDGEREIFENQQEITTDGVEPRGVSRGVEGVELAVCVVCLCCFTRARVEREILQNQRNLTLTHLGPLFVVRSLSSLFVVARERARAPRAEACRQGCQVSEEWRGCFPPRTTEREIVLSINVD